jgi:hypothetical protein
MYLIRFIRSLIYKKPNKQLVWSVEDFKTAKQWSKTQPHPFNKWKTLWDFIYSPRYDSAEVIHEVNKRLGF